jgi:non-specific serine/threonine protein kinase
MTSSETPTFGAWLRRRRRALDLTQAELARQVGYAEATLRKIEADELRPSKELAARLAERLGLTGNDRTAFVRFARGGTPVPDLPALPRAGPIPVPARELPADRPEAASPRHNLPAQLTSYVGHEHDVAELAARLSDPDPARLVTLIGTGGCGKTRLALQVGAALVAAYPDGVWLVELAPLSDPGLVAPTVAATLGIQSAADRPILAQMVDALRERRLLLLLDNCEHLVDACARLADGLLRGCPDLRILATSREALRIDGETRWRVPSLGVPPDDQLPPLADLGQVEAVRLFVERATAAQPDFALSDANAAAVAAICRRLDGIPLALELAAARLPGLSIEQIADRLDQRFRLLTTGSRAALPRQQTLAAAVAWSYDLLDAAERTLFGRLAVFVGSFTLEAAEAVCADDAEGSRFWELGASLPAPQITPSTAQNQPPSTKHLAPRTQNQPLASADVLALLGALVDKSLVVAESAADGAARYRLLETLRQFGAEKLEAAGEAGALGERHAHFYRALAEAGARGRRGPDQVAWLGRLEADHDNLRAALTCLERHDQAVAALRLAGDLAVFWATRGYYAEGRAHLARLLARTETTDRWAERGRALWGAGILADRQGDFGVRRACFEESLACATRADDRATIVRALIGLGKWAASERDDRRAALWLDEAVARARAIGEDWAIADVLTERAVWEADQGEVTLARSHAEELLAITRQSGDTWGIRQALHTLGSIELFEGAYGRVRVLVDEYRAIARALGDRSSIANTLCFEGQVAVGEGAPEVARAQLTEALAIYRDRGDSVGVAVAAANLAELALSQDDPDGARAFAAECLAAAREPGAKHLVNALLCNGDVALAAGDAAAARRFFADALALLGPAGRAGPTAQVLQGFARVAAARNQPVRALRLAGRAATMRGYCALRPAYVDRGLLDRALQPLLDAPGGLSPDEQAAAWADGGAMTPEAAVAYALDEGGV